MRAYLKRQLHPHPFHTHPWKQAESRSTGKYVLRRPTVGRLRPVEGASDRGSPAVFPSFHRGFCSVSLNRSYGRVSRSHFLRLHRSCGRYRPQKDYPSIREVYPICKYVPFHRTWTWTADRHRLKNRCCCFPLCRRYLPAS